MSHPPLAGEGDTVLGVGGTGSSWHKVEAQLLDFLQGDLGNHSRGREKLASMRTQVCEGGGELDAELY